MLPLLKPRVNTYFRGSTKIIVIPCVRVTDYLHPAQDDEVQPPQSEPPPEESLEELLADLPMPKRDMSLFVFFDPHFSQTTSVLAPKTSFSKSRLQSLQ
jgi:hypothetical protein